MRIKELLREKGITAKELASKIGMTETGLSIAMGDNGKPTIKEIRTNRRCFRRASNRTL